MRFLGSMAYRSLGRRQTGFKSLRKKNDLEPLVTGTFGRAGDGRCGGYNVAMLSLESREFLLRKTARFAKRRCIYVNNEVQLVVILIRILCLEIQVVYKMFSWFGRVRV